MFSLKLISKPYNEEFSYHCNDVKMPSHIFKCEKIDDFITDNNQITILRANFVEKMIDIVENIYIISEEIDDVDKITYELQHVIFSGKIVKISENFFKLKDLPKLYIFALLYCKLIINGLNEKAKIYASGGQFDLNTNLKMRREIFHEKIIEDFSENIQFNNNHKELRINSMRLVRKYLIVETDVKIIDGDIFSKIYPIENNLLIKDNTYYIPISKLCEEINLNFNENPKNIFVKYSYYNVIVTMDGAMVRRFI